MARFGVLTVALEMLPFVTRGLPPEHRIEAMRPDDRRRAVDLLIAGPFMPAAVADADPPVIEMLFTMHRDDPASDAVRVTGTIHLREDRTYPRPSLGDWEVGRWASLDALRQERQSL